MTKLPPNEYRRRGWGPAGAGKNGRIEQFQRSGLFTGDPAPALKEASTVEYGKELAVRSAYEGFIESIGEDRPTKLTPVVYFACRRDGHPNVLECKRPGFDPMSPLLLDWILAEENVREMPCRRCGKRLFLMMRLGYDDLTLKVTGSIDTYCIEPACLAVTRFVQGPFRQRRIHPERR